MAKRKYTHIKIIEPKLIAMREVGKTNRELAEYFGLKIRQIENWINRYHREQACLVAGFPPKRRGRPRKSLAPTNIREYQCKDDELIKHIQYCQKSNDNTYGYRRVWLWLKKKGRNRNTRILCIK